MKKIKNKIALSKGYPNWEEYENWIIENNYPVAIAQLLVGAMEEVVIEYHKNEIMWVDINIKLPDKNGTYWVKYKNGKEEKIGYYSETQIFVFGTDNLNDLISHWKEV